VAIPKKQHFIPRLHLKHFVGADPQGQIWTYDAQTGNVHSAIPEETAIETHFYSMEKPDGTMDTRIEECLASIESNAAPVYEALLRGEIPKDSQVRSDFSAFLALMYFRTPVMRRMFAELYSRIVQIKGYAYGSIGDAFDTLIQRIEGAQEIVLDTDQKEQFRQYLLDPSGYTVEIPKKLTLPVLVGIEKLAPRLFGMTWSIVTPVHGFFITSDNPLIIGVDPNTDYPVDGDGDFLKKTAQVIFPLSPQSLLLMSCAKSAPEAGIFERDQMVRINRALAAHSERYLYAHIRHKRLQALATEFKNLHPGITTQGFGPDKFAETKVRRRGHK
jgi:Protein of unknown function (DUF4238)